MASTPSSGLLSQLDALRALLDKMRLGIGQLAAAPVSVEHASRYLADADAALRMAARELKTPTTTGAPTPPHRQSTPTLPGVNEAVAMSHPVNQLVAVQRQLQADQHAADARSNSRRLVLSPEEARRICDERDALIGSRS